MASVTLPIAGRQYTVGCQSGEESRLIDLARMVDDKARKSVEILGGDTTEVRRLLFAALLLADALSDAQTALAKHAQPALPLDPVMLAVEPAANQAELDQLAVRLERLAEMLERQP
jgi:cell division protein ZapA